MVQRNQIPEEVNDIELYKLLRNALEDSNIAPGDIDASNIGRYTTQFNDLSTVERKQFINIQPSQGLTVLRDIEETTNSATIESLKLDGEIELSTGTQANSQATIDTAKWGQYTPGYISQIGIGARLPQQPTDDGNIQWGYFNGSEGFYFGYDSGGMYVALLNNGQVVQKVYRADWNGTDPDDVNNVTFSPEDGAIFQINYAWYGYGSIQFSIITSDTNTPQRNILVHTFSTRGGTSIGNPNQPVRARVFNGGSGNDITAYIGGRQYSILGSVTDNFRISSETVTNVPVANNAWTHIASFRRQANSQRRTNALIDSFDFNANSSVRAAIVLNANISGQTWRMPELQKPDETVMEFGDGGTFDGIGNGVKLYETYLDVGQSSKGSVSDPIRELDQPIPREYPFTLLMKGVSSTAEVDATLRVREQW